MAVVPRCADLTGLRWCGRLAPYANFHTNVSSPDPPVIVTRDQPADFGRRVADFFVPKIFAPLIFVLTRHRCDSTDVADFLYL